MRCDHRRGIDRRDQVFVVTQPGDFDKGANPKDSVPIGFQQQNNFTGGPAVHQAGLWSLQDQDD